jgi:xanthine/CO dehydrogenase XdhC/CoxF family maturation factor
MSRREIERLLDAIREARAAGTRVALATVVRIHGSAYRREGAQILVREDGTYECALSGGCLEPAVAEAARAAIVSGERAVLRYDLADDSIFGLGVGCSGAVDILIERLDDSPVSRAWESVLERGDSAVLVTPLRGATGRLLVHPQDAIGRLSGPAADIAALARERLAEPFPPSGSVTVGSIEYFLAVSVPPPRLVIFGAGHDAVPLARGAWELGFEVTVVDPRLAFLTPQRFPRMELVAAQPEDAAARIPGGPRTSVVIMNHHIDRDRASVRAALESSAAYVGVLGPRTRLDKLLDGLAEAGWRLPPDARARLRSPVGLAIGAETPEEIAVSVLGEVVAAQRGFDGGVLSGRAGSLHRGSIARAAARS